MIIIKKQEKRKISSIFLIVIVAISSCGVGFVGYMINEYYSMANSILAYSPDPSEFLVADNNLLNETAHELDFRFSTYHLPLNQTARAMFVNDTETYGYLTYTNVSYYDFSDNEALWTGISFAGWCYKYLTAVKENDLEMEEYSLNVLKNMTTGLSLLMEIPNGGLGSQYSGILARGIAPPGSEYIWYDIYEDHPKHFNGTDQFSQWRWRGYTSNDEHGGYYLFLALVIKYLSDIPELYEPVKLIVDQLCNYMLKNNFLGIHGTGAWTGVNQKPVLGTGGFWTVTLLKMGALCFPDKYERLYYHYAANELTYLSAKEAANKETFANYFAYNFAHCTVLAFLLLENVNTRIGSIYFNGYMESLRAYTWNHRNAWFNAIYLMICYENMLIIQDNDIVGDISDQLMRIAQNKLPYVLRRMQQELPEGYQLINPVKEFTDRFHLGPSFQSFIGIDDSVEFLNKPLTAEYMNTELWVWEQSPFKWDPDRKSYIEYEQPPMFFTVPYWMLRYCGHLSVS